MNEQEQLIQKGMQLTASLPDIMPDQASTQIKPIYEDIQHTLRVPLVNLIFRTLANYPHYLEMTWNHFSPAMKHNSFEQEADNLREKALLEQFPFETTLDLTGVEDAEKLRAFNDTIFYVLPKLLLTATVFYEGSFRTISERRSRGQEAGQDTPLALGAADGTAKVNMLSQDEASEQVKKLFDAIKQKHGHPLVSSYFRGLANWPQVLEQSWTAISPVVGTPEYENLKLFLIDQAQTSLRRIPFTQPSTIPLSGQEKEEMQAILAAFRYKFIPEMLIDAAMIKALFDGPEEAFTSRFSAATSPEEPEQ